MKISQAFVATAIVVATIVGVVLMVGSSTVTVNVDLPAVTIPAFVEDSNG